MAPNNSTSNAYTGTRFDHDIFVSYSHGIQPPDGGDSDLKKWTQALILKLREHIGYSLEEQKIPIKIWYDDELQGHVALTDTLKQKVEKSAMLLIIMTRNYLASEWCEKEREWFKREITERGGGVENVFVVRAMATDNAEWPDFLKDGYGETVLGFPFCNEEKGKKARPFGWVIPTDSSDTFITSLTNLASDMATRLDEIREEEQASVTTPIVPDVPETRDNKDWRVFIAPGTEDVRPVVREIRSLLVQKGCVLYPEAEVRIEDFTEQQENEALSAARAFVQLIGSSPAREKGADIGRVQQLNQRARDHSIEQFLGRNHLIPLQALDYDQIYKNFVTGLGDIPDRGPSELIRAVVDHLRRNENNSEDDQPLTVFMEVPGEALNKFDQLQNDIRSDRCLLLPLKAPRQGSIGQIQDERKSRQLVYGACKAVLLMYCVADQLDWLKGAIINYLKDVATVQRVERKKAHAPAPIVIDYVGEAKVLADVMGVDVIRRDAGTNPEGIWQHVRRIAA